MGRRDTYLSNRNCRHRGRCDSGSISEGVPEEERSGHETDMHTPYPIKSHLRLRLIDGVSGGIFGGDCRARLLWSNKRPL
jgi:hypothetical protein